MIQINTEDNVTPALDQLKERLSPRRIVAEIGPRATRLVQRNFRAQPHNAKGFPPVNFWGKAAQATNWRMESDGAAVVYCTQIGVRQQLYGGTIEPVNAGALTIPATPEAYGHRAREFNNLRFKIVANPATGKMCPALVEAEASKIRIGKRGVKKTGETTGTKVFYWLAQHVTTKPHPSVMPPDADFQKAVSESVGELTRFS